MKIHFISLGCKTNQYETNAMEQKFIEKDMILLKMEKSRYICCKYL